MRISLWWQCGLVNTEEKGREDEARSLFFFSKVRIHTITVQCGVLLLGWWITKDCCCVFFCIELWRYFHWGWFASQIPPKSNYTKEKLNFFLSSTRASFPWQRKIGDSFCRLHEQVFLVKENLSRKICSCRFGFTINIIKALLITQYMTYLNKNCLFKFEISIVSMSITSMCLNPDKALTKKKNGHWGKNYN